MKLIFHNLSAFLLAVLVVIAAASPAGDGYITGLPEDTRLVAAEHNLIFIVRDPAPWDGRP